MNKIILFRATISLLIALNNSVFATSSSTFLISQLAFKNYDYPATLLNFNADKIKLSQDQLLDKAIAAIRFLVSKIIPCPFFRLGHDHHDQTMDYIL